MSTEGSHPEFSHTHLGYLRQAFDAACQELGIGIEGLDFPSGSASSSALSVWRDKGKATSMPCKSALFFT